MAPFSTASDNHYPETYGFDEALSEATPLCDLTVQFPTTEELPAGGDIRVGKFLKFFPEFRNPLP